MTKSVYRHYEEYEEALEGMSSISRLGSTIITITKNLIQVFKIYLEFKQASS
jgi:hypothetical protein